ncbi:MAG: hypothetical protein AABY18_07780 [Candidatus Thermoplasmatota archaeon]
MQSLPGVPVVPRPSRVPLIVAACAVTVAIALGTVLRLVDPLSSSVIPAEDPYNHMALVREHIRTGELNALNEGETLYPPGLHAFLAAAWVYTGSDLYDLMRFGPVLFGAIGILGIAFLLWRTAGPVAGVVGAFAIAVAPEAIFRSTMMSPTALDLAVLPFFLYALLRILAGRIGYVGVAAPLAAFLAVAHPWLLAILCSAGAVFVLLLVALPSKTTRATAATVPGIAGLIAVLGGGLGLALLMPNFGGTLNLPESAGLDRLGLALIALALAPALILLRWRRRDRAEAWLARAPVHWITRTALSLTIAAALAATLLAARSNGFPALVDLPRMIGWPILVLAAAAAIALPFIPSPMAKLATALAAVTLPFTIFNPMRSEFLPHRTIIFLCFALVLLAGVAAGALATAAASAWRTAAARSARTSTASPRVSRPWLAAAPALLVAVLASGSVYAGTPDGYPGGWYRLYNECELNALREIADQANADPTLIVITGSWQSKLVLAALIDDASRVWFKGDFFTSAEARDDLVAQSDHAGVPLVVVAERHLRGETPDANLDFTASEPWQPAGAWCANLGMPQPRVTAFATGDLPGRAA